MGTKNKCPDGQKMDNLIRVCMPRPEPAPQSEPPLVVLSPVRGKGSKTQHDPVKATDPASPGMLGLSPALCAIIVLVTVGSILALAVWLFIYRRQKGLSSSPVDSETVIEPLQKTEPPATIIPPPLERNGHAEMCTLAAEAPSPCPHLYLGTQMGSNWEKGFTTCRGPTVQPNGFIGLPVCSTVSEHRIPLPATELGGTALVTTKTI